MSQLAPVQESLLSNHDEHGPDNALAKGSGPGLAGAFSEYPGTIFGVTLAISSFRAEHLNLLSCSPQDTHVSQAATTAPRPSYHHHILAPFASIPTRPTSSDCAFSNCTVSRTTQSTFYLNFMHREPTKTSTQFKSNRSPRTTPPTQHGIFDLQLDGAQPGHEQPQRPRSASPQSVLGGRGDDVASRAVNADQLEAKLRGLRVDYERLKTPGQRIAEYEKALAPSTPRQALGFKVIKRVGARSDGIQFEDFPNG
jgi:hypothetical protein